MCADRFHRFDPASTGPNILAWCEWEYWLNFGDRGRLTRVFPVLLAYHRWCKRYRTWYDPGFRARVLRYTVIFRFAGQTARITAAALLVAWTTSPGCCQGNLRGQTTRTQLG
jgi:hypothetical protein